MTSDEPEQPDRTEELAACLEWPAQAFARVLGSGWTENPGPVRHDYDSDPSGGGGLDVTPWMIAGSPAQLMARVFDHGVFLARPEGVWAGGTHDLVYQPRDQQYVALEGLESEGPEVVNTLLRGRRRSFRYCRYCRDLTPPELRMDDACMRCASTWEGVVY